MTVTASIVIRTRNEGRHLERLLKGIQQQTYKDFEIVLVDSGSTDNTLEIASRYGCRIEHIPASEFTFGRSLNLGCRQALGRYLVFVSGHTYPVTNSWLANLVRPFDDGSVAMVYGRQRGVETSRVSEERDLERMFGAASRILIDELYGHNGNAAIRRDLWEMQPFDESLTGLEDLDWVRKMQRRGYRVYYAADSSVYHVHEERLTQVYQRHLREGHAYARIASGYQYGVGDVAYDILYHTAGDLLYCFRRRKSVRKILQVPGTRIAQFFGVWKGLRGHTRGRQSLAETLKRPAKSEGVVIEAPGKFGLREIPVPEIAPHDVLIQIAYVGACATDVEVAHGKLEYYRSGYARYPIVPGHEYSGVVVDHGHQVTRFRKGDRVVAECAIGCEACAWCRRKEYFRCLHRKEVGVINRNGAYARYVATPDRYLHKLPSKVRLKPAALIEPLAVCLKALRKLGEVAGRSVCVVGAGPLGNLCAQILKQRRAEVMVIDHDEHRLRLLQRYDINVQAELYSIDAFDYLIDATGNEAVLPRLIEQSRPSSKILLLGLPYATPVSVSFATVPCYDKEIYGSIASEPRDWEEAIALVNAGKINLQDHLSHILPLESYEVAWTEIENRSCFKVLLAVNETIDCI